MKSKFVSLEHISPLTRSSEIAQGVSGSDDLPAAIRTPTIKLSSTWILELQGVLQTLASTTRSRLLMEGSTSSSGWTAIRYKNAFPCRQGHAPNTPSNAATSRKHQRVEYSWWVTVLPANQEASGTLDRDHATVQNGCIPSPKANRRESQQQVRNGTCAPEVD